MRNRGSGGEQEREVVAIANMRADTKMGHPVSATGATIEATMAQRTDTEKRRRIAIACLRAETLYATIAISETSGMARGSREDYEAPGPKGMIGRGTTAAAEDRLVGNWTFRVHRPP